MKPICRQRAYTLLRSLYLLGLPGIAKSSPSFAKVLKKFSSWHQELFLKVWRLYTFSSSYPDQTLGSSALQSIPSPSPWPWSFQMQNFCTSNTMIPPSPASLWEAPHSMFAKDSAIQLWNVCRSVQCKWPCYKILPQNTCYRNYSLNENMWTCPKLISFGEWSIVRTIAIWFPIQ